MVRTLLFVFVVGASTPTFAQRPKQEPAPPVPRYQHAIQGTVFKDANGNGKRDAGEPGMRGVAVSDGLDVAMTDDDGLYTLANADKEAVFAWVHQPGNVKQDGQQFFHRLPHDATADARFDFGLQRVAKGGAKPDSKAAVRFVQLTDSHVRNVGDRDYMIQATNEIYAMDPPPDFVVATGDLVDWGVDEHYQNYVAGMQKPPVPYFNVFGNHEIVFGNIERYYQYIGPDYFSFDRGDVLFIALNCVTPSKRQDQWLANVLKQMGKGRSVVVFQHFPPSNEQLQKFAGLGVKSVFSGHWHSEKEIEHAGVQSVNSPTFIMGGIDASPAGFKVVELSSSGAAKTEWRYGFQKERLTIVSPQKGHPVDGSYFPILVNAYDTTKDVSDVKWRLGTKKKSVAKGTLRKESASGWSGAHGHSHTHDGKHFHTHGPARKQTARTAPASSSTSKLPRGSYSIEVEAHTKGGATWKKRQQVEIIEGAPAAPAPEKDWPMFMGSAAHTGSATASLGRSPLRLAWAVDTGGDIDFASPILADGKIYLALKKRTLGRTNGVAAFDPVTGKRLWLFETKMAVNHTPAFEGGTLCVAEMGGSIYGVEAATGLERWRHDLIDDTGRFCYCAPAAHDGFFYAGVMRLMVKLNAEDGSVGWEKQVGPADNDWISSYGSPAVGDGKMVMSGHPARGNALVVVHTEDGSPAWGRASAGGMLASASIVDDRVLFATTKSILYCHKLEGGEEIWNVHLGDAGKDANWSATTPAVQQTGEGEGIVVAGSGDGRMSGVNLADGKILWTHVSDETILKVSPYRRDDRPLLSSPTIVGDVVYFGSADGHLYCVDLKTGEEVWSYEIGATIMSTPLVSGNALYVAAYDGRLYAFTAGASERP